MNGELWRDERERREEKGGVNDCWEEVGWGHDRTEEKEKEKAGLYSPAEAEGKMRLGFPAMVEVGFVAEKVAEAGAGAKAREMIGEGMPSERERERVERSGVEQRQQTETGISL